MRLPPPGVLKNLCRDRGDTRACAGGSVAFPSMANSPRSLLASAIGWLIVVLIAFWVIGLVLGWVGAVVRSVGWLLLIGLLVATYLAIKAPPDD